MKKIIIITIILVALVGSGVYLLVIKNDGRVDCNYQYQEAQYFLASTTNFLLIDQGTAPDPRTLIVYDLNECNKTYEGQYSKPFEIKDEAVTFWEPTKEEVNDKNCPKRQEYLGGGLGVGIESHITMDLFSLVKKSLSETRCSPRQ